MFHASSPIPSILFVGRFFREFQESDQRVVESEPGMAGGGLRGIMAILGSSWNSRM